LNAERAFLIVGAVNVEWFKIDLSGLRHDRWNSDMMIYPQDTLLSG